MKSPEQAYRTARRDSARGINPRVKKALVALGIITVLLTAHTCAYNDAKREHAHYCAMVADGHWPAYKGECDDDESR